MPTTFHVPRNNAATTVASSYTAGSGTLTVANGSVFPTTFPFRLSTFTAAGSPKSILTITGRSGNVLTVGGAIEGTTDVNLSVGDLAELRVTAGALSDIHTAVGALETAPPAHTHTLSAITDAGTAASRNAPAAGNAASAEVVLGSDTRLSDSRVPVAHTHDASAITTGTVATARLGSGTANSTTFLRGDQSYAAPVASITLTISGAIHTSPVTFSNTAGAWSGTLSLATQTANTVFAGPSSAGPSAPTFRQLGHGELSGLTTGDPHTQYVVISPGAGRNVIQASGSTVVPLEVRGAASQTGDLTQWENSSGTVLSAVDASGRLALGHTSVLTGFRSQINALTSGRLLVFAGTALFGGGGSTAGVATVLSFNDVNNRQLSFFDSAQVGVVGNSGFRLILGPAIPLLDSVNGDGTANRNLGLGQPSSLVGIGFTTTDAQADITAQLHVRCGLASRVASIVRGAASQTGDLTQWQNSAGTVLSRVDAGGYLVTVTSAGAPSASAPDGALAVDTTNHKLYFRSGGVWRGPLG